ncbi:MAG: DUF5615 family PIN-like protein [Chitinispirillaceae bacterium]|nr:DUF5615 family PIN-like protein [Chitinispirillaceae bacterium]
MKFFFDQNLSDKLVRGLREFGEDVIHLKEEYPNQTDVADAEWLQNIGQKGWILISRDEYIRWHPAEIKAFRENGVGAFLLCGKGKKAWEIIQQVIRHWLRIKELADRTSKPFFLKYPPRALLLFEYQSNNTAP